MNILISGASGLIGSALSEYLNNNGHNVYQLKRSDSQAPFTWQPDKGLIILPPNVLIDVVVNLNGVNIGDKPWTAKRKQEIIESRINATQLISKTISRLDPSPKVLINASAVGYYGETGNTTVDEASSSGNNFLTEIVSQWESAAEPAIKKGIRTVFIRSGVVLSTDGGALKKMLIPFKFGLGGRVGSGNQYMSWISLEDEIRAIDFIMNNNQVNGPINLTSPTPVTNTEFTQTLSTVLKRPCIFPLPKSVLKLLFGEMGELLLLGSVKAVPTALISHGFEFKHPKLIQAFKTIIR